MTIDGRGGEGQQLDAIKLLAQASPNSFRANRGQRERVYGLLPESQDRNLAVTVLRVPCSRRGGEGQQQDAMKLLAQANPIRFVRGAICHFLRGEISQGTLL